MALLLINGKKFAMNSLKELVTKLKTVKNSKYAEIWLVQEAENSICVLVNEKLAFVMFAEQNEECLHSFNPNIENEDIEIEFELSNGQHDFYPLKNCVDKKNALKAIESFFETKEKPKDIFWHKS